MREWMDDLTELFAPEPSGEEVRALARLNRATAVRKNMLANYVAAVEAEDAALAALRRIERRAA